MEARPNVLLLPRWLWTPVVRQLNSIPICYIYGEMVKRKRVIIVLDYIRKNRVLMGKRGELQEAF